MTFRRVLVLGFRRHGSIVREERRAREGRRGFAGARDTVSHGLASLALAVAALAACDGPRPIPIVDVTVLDTNIDATALDVVYDVTQPDGALGTEFCALGTDVPMAVVPPGFCLRRFQGDMPLPGTTGHLNPRAIAFAPNGDLFVSSPGWPGAGGGSFGIGGILILSDDNRDGVAEVHGFLVTPDTTNVHGIAFGGDALYYTTDRAIMRADYTVGQRAATITSMVAPMPDSGDSRMTHGLARTPGGTMFVSVGRLSGSCPDPGGSGYIALVESGSTALVAQGFRNPMYMRCHFRDEVCFANELGDDGGNPGLAYEKLLSIHGATDYGYPCCWEPGQPGSGNSGSVSCASVTAEEVQIPLHDTPFGLDWERGLWPAPFTNAMFIAKHGSFYSSPPWQGASIVYAPTDPNTHAPNQPLQPFIEGFGPSGQSLNRPADVTFSHDGRMFFADDYGNAIYWVAPRGLRMPAH